MNTLARETEAPALFGYVMGSDCVVVEAAGPESGAWTTCLARRAMAAYLGDGEGLTVEDYFLRTARRRRACRRLGRGGRAGRRRAVAGRCVDLGAWTGGPFG